VTRAPRDERRPFPTVRLLVRLLTAALSLATLWLSLTASASILQAYGPTSHAMLDELPARWYAQAGDIQGDSARRLFDIMEATPDKAFTVGLTVTETPVPTSSTSGSDVQVRVSASISGPVDEPLIAAVRRGDASWTSDQLLATVIGRTHINNNWALNLGPPRVRVSGDSATVLVEAGLTLARSELKNIVIDDPLNCRVLDERHIRVTLADYAIAGVRAVGDFFGCPAGHWSDQGDQSAGFDGLGQATLVLTTKVAAPSRDAAAPLLTFDFEARNVRNTMFYGALSVFPLLLVWWRLRRLRSNVTRGEARTVVSRTVVVVGALTILHVVTDALTVASILHNSLTGAVLHHWSPLVLGFPPLYQVMYAVTMVTIAYVWRRGALRAALDTRGKPWTGRFDLATTLLITAGLVVSVVISVDRYPGPLVPYSWSTWAKCFLDGWPGVLLSGAGLVCIAVRVVPPLIHRLRPAGVPPVSSRAARTGSGAIAGAIFVVVMLFGFMHAPFKRNLWTDEHQVPRWWEWLSTGTGILSFLGSVVAVAIVVSLALLTEWAAVAGRRRAAANLGVATIILTLALLVSVYWFAIRPTATWEFIFRGGWIGGLPPWNMWRMSGPGVVSLLAGSLSVRVS
jgi:hypothetical protein